MIKNWSWITYILAVIGVYGMIQMGYNTVHQNAPVGAAPPMPPPPMNAVVVPLPPHEQGNLPSTCIEFDYTPVGKNPTLRAPLCRMLWCGSYNGGLATLWCH